MLADTLTLLLFVCLMVGTPGPANMVLMIAGGRFGFRRSILFLLGITFGKFLLNILMAIGLYDILSRYDLVFELLKYICAGYMIFLSWRMARTPLTGANQKDLAKPPGFLQGLIIHPLNPKAWAMMTIAWSEYGGAFVDPFMRFVVISGTFMLVQLVAHSLWCYAGHRLMGFVQDKKLQRYIQYGLSGLTMAVVLWVVFGT